ncbi:MAG: multidrug effflux MFS transporter [Corynebacterium sp.]|nr:multidrug effflux MFS transporter [Corynebacterium sp.]
MTSQVKTTTQKQKLTGGLLIGLAILTALAPFATDMYLPSFPQVQADLNSDSAMVQLTLTTFMVGMGLGQLLLGPISDSRGRRGLLIGSAVLSILASVLCAIAPNIGVLLIARTILGFGSGGSAVLARSVVSDLVTGKKAAQAFGILAMIQGLAPVIAPILGGVLDKPIGWRGIFFVLAGIAALQLFISFGVKESRPVEERTDGALGPQIRVFIQLLGQAEFRGYALAFGFGFASLFAYISASPFIIQEQLGRPTIVYSILFAINALGMVAGVMISNRLLKSFDAHVILRAALIAMTVLGVAVLVAGFIALNIWVVCPLLFLAVSSVGFVLGNATALGQEAAGRFAGAGSAVMGFLQAIFGGLMSPLVSIGGNPTVASGVCIAICSLLAVFVVTQAGKAGAATATTAGQK